METERMKHYYKLACSFTVYMMRDRGIEELFHMLVTSNQKKVSVSFFNGSSHIPSKCGKKTSGQTASILPKLLNFLQFYSLYIASAIFSITALLNRTGKLFSIIIPLKRSLQLRTGLGILFNYYSMHGVRWLEELEW